MKMDVVAGSKNDEFYTPLYAIKPIEKYLKPNSNIWCPFDSDESLFVKDLKKQGHRVINTNLDSGGDFFKLIKSNIPDHVDYIISNPPYSLKTEVLQALFDKGVPFAMLLGVVGLFESQKRFDMFKNNKFEILYLNRRVSYFKSYEEQKPSKNPPFSSVYLTSGILPKQICFQEIDKNILK